MPATETQIRDAVRREIASRYESTTDPVIDEFGLCNGAARVDVVVVNGALHGYEIKSARDTLQRLPRQVEIYGRVLDYATVVVARKHEEAARLLVPQWWGVSVVADKPSEITLRVKRKAKRNPAVRGEDVARLLWRDELLAALRAHGAAGKAGKLTQILLARRLAETLELPALQDLVRSTLKTRFSQGWRSGVLAGDEANVVVG